MPFLGIKPSERGRFGGVEGFMFPEGLSMEEMLVKMETYRRSLIGAGAPSQPPPPPPEPTRDSFMEDIGRGLVAGSTDVLRGVTSLGEMFEVPGAAKATEALGEFRTDIAPRVSDPRPLFQIFEEDGSLAAVGEAGERLPGQLATIVPQIASLLIPAGAIGLGGKVLGAASSIKKGEAVLAAAKTAEEIFKAKKALGLARLTRKAQIASTFAVGGPQESVGTLEELRTLAKKQGISLTKNDERFVYFTTSIVIGALNTIGLGAILKPFTSGAGPFVRKLVEAVVAGGTEALTEVAEEPANFAILKAAGVDPGDFVTRMKAALDVAPPSFLAGFLGGGAGAVFSPDTRQEILNGTEGEVDTKMIEFAPEGIDKLARDMKLSTEEATSAARITAFILSARAIQLGRDPMEYFIEQFPTGLTQDAVTAARELMSKSGLKSMLPEEQLFFTRSLAAIESAPDNLFNKEGLAPASRIRKYLNKRIKKEEAAALELDRIVPENSSALVAKDALLDFISEHTIEIEEVPLGLTGEQLASHPVLLHPAEEIKRLSGIKAEVLADTRVRFEGENGEVFVTEPLKNNIVTRDMVTRPIDALIGDFGNRPALDAAITRYLETVSRGTSDPPFVNRYSIPDAINNNPQIFALTVPLSLPDSHDGLNRLSPKPNRSTLAWMRVTTREVDGKKYLVIEEIQSDVIEDFRKRQLRLQRMTGRLTGQAQEAVASARIAFNETTQTFSEARAAFEAARDVINGPLNLSEISPEEIHSVLRTLRAFSDSIIPSVANQELLIRTRSLIVSLSSLAGAISVIQASEVNINNDVSDARNEVRDQISTVTNAIRELRRNIFLSEATTSTLDDVSRFLPEFEDIDTIDAEEVRSLRADFERIAAPILTSESSVTFSLREAGEILISGLVDLEENLLRKSTKEPPFQSNFPSLLLSRALSIASARNLDGVMIASGEEQIRRYPGLTEEQQNGLLDFYDRVLPERLNKLIRKFKGAARVQLRGHTFRILQGGQTPESPVHTLDLDKSVKEQIGDEDFSLFTRRRSAAAGELVGLEETESGEFRIVRKLLRKNKQGGFDVKASKFLIRGYAASNISVFFHEFAHWVLLTAEGDFLAAVEKAFTPGKTRAQWTIRDHEIFATTFSAYMFHGKSPRPELDASMQVVKEKTRAIYKTMRKLMEADPRFFGRNRFTTDKRVIPRRGEKFRAIDMLFETDISTRDFGAELSSDLFLNSLLNQSDTSDPEKASEGLMAKTARFKGRVNGINIANLSGLISESDFRRIVLPVLVNMERSGLSRAIPWEETIAKAQALMGKSGSAKAAKAFKKIAATVQAGQIPPPHEILAMTMIWASSTTQFVDIMTSKKSTQAAYKKYADNISKIMMDMGSMSGRALNTYKIFIALKELETSLQTLNRELTDRELESLANLDLTDLGAIKREIEDVLKGKGAKKKRALKRVLLALFYNSMLFNPGTVGINIIGNIAQVAYQAGNRALIGAVDAVASKITGRQRQVLVSESWQILAALSGNLFKTAFLRDSPANEEIKRGLRGELENSIVGVTQWDDKISANIITAFEDYFKELGGKYAKFAESKQGKLLLGALNGGSRLLVAADFWTKAVAREAYLGNGEKRIGIIGVRTNALLKQQLREQGLSLKDLTHERIQDLTQKARETVVSNIAADETWISLSDEHKKIMRQWEREFKRQNKRFPSGTERLEFMTSALNAKEVTKTSQMVKRIVALKKQEMIEKARRLGKPKPTEEQLKAAETLTSEDLVVIREQAHIERIQNHWTFQDEPGKIGSGIINIRDQVPILGRMLVPFISTVLNITKRSAELTPGLGAIVGGPFGRLSPSEVVAKQIQGMVLALVIASLVSRGEITGPPPDKESERNANLRRGVPPWSIKLPGDVWVDYRRFDPFATPVAMVAAFMEEIRRIDRDVKNPALQEIEFMEQAGRLFGSLSTTFINTTWFENMLKFTAGENIGDLKRQAARTTSTLVPYSSMWRSIYRAYVTSTEGGFPVSRRPSFMEMFASGSGLAGITGIKPNTKLTLFGEESRRGLGIPAAWIPPDHPEARKAAAFLGSLFPATAPFPATAEARPIDPVENEFVRLEVYPGMPNETVTLPGFADLQRFDEEVYRKYVIRAGHRIKDELEKVISTRRYQRSDDESKKIAIHKILVKIRNSLHKVAVGEELKLRRQNNDRKSTIQQSAALARRIASSS